MILVFHPPYSNELGQNIFVLSWQCIVIEPAAPLPSMVVCGFQKLGEETLYHRGSPHADFDESTQYIDLLRETTVQLSGGCWASEIAKFQSQLLQRNKCSFLQLRK